MAETVVTLSGDDKALLAALKRLTGAQDGVDAGFKKVKKSSDDASKAIEEAQKKAARDAEKLEKVFKDQKQQLELQLVALKKGSVAATEMKAIQQGLTKEQAQQLALLQKQVNVEKELQQKQGQSTLVEKLTAAGAAYVSLNSAANLFTDIVDKQIERQEQVVALTKAVAAAQQEAAKNLSGVAIGKISAALENAVPQIAIESGFADIPALTTALGSSASIVGDELAKSVVEAAAKLEKLTPFNLQTTATSGADLVKATGVSDAREAYAMLLSAGSVARPEELSRLSLGAVKAVNAGTLASPTQDKTEAAKESAALFAMLTKVDKSGESAATATAQFIDQLRTLFKDRPDDPGTLVGRLDAVRNDEELRTKMLGDLKGEAIFKPIFESLLNIASGDSKELSNALNNVTTDVKVFEEALKTLNVTVQQRIANAGANAAATVAVSDFRDLGAAKKGQASEVFKKAMEATATGFLESFENTVMLSPMLGGYLPSGDSQDRTLKSPEGYIGEKLRLLNIRQTRLSKMRQTPEVTAKLEVLNAAKQSLRDIAAVAPNENPASPSQENSQTPKKLDEQTAEMKKQTALLEKMAGSPTGAGNTAPSAAAIQAQSQMGVSQGVRTQ